MENIGIRSKLQNPRGTITVMLKFLILLAKATYNNLEQISKFLQNARNLRNLKVGSTYFIKPSNIKVICARSFACILLCIMIWSQYMGHSTQLRMYYWVDLTHVSRTLALNQDVQMGYTGSLISLQHHNFKLAQFIILLLLLYWTESSSTKWSSEWERNSSSLLRQKPQLWCRYADVTARTRGLPISTNCEPWGYSPTCCTQDWIRCVW